MEIKKRWLSVCKGKGPQQRIARRFAKAQAATLGWDRYVGIGGTVVGMHGFGASAPLKDLLKKFGFTADAVLAAAQEQIARTGST